MKKKKKIILICSECYSRNYRISNNINLEDKEIKKHCSKCNKHTIHRVTR